MLAFLGGAARADGMVCCASSERQELGRAKAACFFRGDMLCACFWLAIAGECSWWTWLFPHSINLSWAAFEWHLFSRETIRQVLCAAWTSQRV